MTAPADREAMRVWEETLRELAEIRAEVERLSRVLEALVSRRALPGEQGGS